MKPITDPHQAIRELRRVVIRLATTPALQPTLLGAQDLADRLSLDDARRVLDATAKVPSNASMAEALRRLLACPDLNLDELEPETRAAIEAADDALGATPCQS